MINVKKTVAHASEFNTKILQVKIFLQILKPDFVTEASFKLIDFPHNKRQMGGGVRDLLFFLDCVQF